MGNYALETGKGLSNKFSSKTELENRFIVVYQAKVVNVLWFKYIPAILS